MVSSFLNESSTKNVSHEVKIIWSLKPRSAYEWLETDNIDFVKIN